MILAFTGGREAKNGAQVFRVLALIAADAMSEGTLDHIYVGDARGIDTMVLDFFKGEVPIGVEHAAWKSKGKVAGHIRNGHILDHKPDILVAFPGGEGTQNCKNEAKRRDIPVMEITQYMLDNATLIELEEELEQDQ